MGSWQKGDDTRWHFWKIIYLVLIKFRGAFGVKRSSEPLLPTECLVKFITYQNYKDKITDWHHLSFSYEVYRVIPFGVFWGSFDHPFTLNIVICFFNFRNILSLSTFFDNLVYGHYVLSWVSILEAHWPKCGSNSLLGIFRKSDKRQLFTEMLYLLVLIYLFNQKCCTNIKLQ